MRSFAQLFAAATVITRAFAQTQYSDGYENVNNPTDPVQIRLAYQGPTGMMVSWNTFQQLPNPTVIYGTSPNALTLTASSSVSVTYATSLTYNNHVNITGLQPFTTYYYLPQYSNATTPYTFTTARLAGDATPYTVGVVVDMGTFGVLGLSDVVGTGAANPLGVNEQTTISALTEAIDSLDHIIHAGDIAYADYWLKEEIQNYLPTTTTQQGATVYESILNAFFDEMEGITSQKAYMVAAGNHEANCDNGGTTNTTSGVKYTESICLPGQTNFTGYINHWRMPSGPSGGLGNFWYSYDYGMTHFIVIDTETDLGNGLVGPDEGSPEYGGPFGSYNQQINWLTADLASINRTVTPWIVVFGHRGWYLSASGSVCPNCQTAFETLLHTYDVDLYINGHAHIYERTAPIYNNVIDPNGLNNPSSTLYLTNGAAGHYDGLDKFTAIQPYSVYRQAADYCWTSLTFTNSTHMTLNSLWSANNTVFDSATLIKSHIYTSTTTSSTSTSSSSTSSATSSASTNPTTTTNTATTTSTASYPTYTNFNGQGHLYVYSQGILEGDIGSADTWYNTPGQNTATYTAVPLYPNGTAFTLQHSTDYCNIASDSSFECASAASGATVFGQTPDGELTYNGSPEFYALSSANSGAKPTVYVTPLPVTLIISWGVGNAASTISLPTTTSSSSVSTTSSSSTTTSTSSTGIPSTTSSSSTSGSTSSTSTTSSTSSSASSTSTTSSSSTRGSTSTSGSSSSPTGSATVSVTITQSVTTTSLSISDIFVTSTQVSSATVTSTEVDTSTETDSVTLTQATTSTETDVITSTEIDSTTLVQISTETDVSTSTLPAITSYITLPEITSTSISISYITLPAVTVTSASTETDINTATTSLPALTSYITTCPASLSSKYITSVTTLTALSTITDVKITHTTTYSIVSVTETETKHTTTTSLVSVTETQTQHTTTTSLVSVTDVETKHTTTTSLATVTDYATTHTTSTITSTVFKTLN